jgi:hypothetical protein
LLLVTRVAGNHFAWKLEVKVTGDQTAAYVPFAAGTTFKAPGDGAHRGRGTIGVDLDAYKTVNTGFPGQGKLFVAFSHHGVGMSDADGGTDDLKSKTLVYVLRNFSADTSQWQPVDALFYAHKNGLSGVTSVRVRPTATSRRSPTTRRPRALPRSCPLQSGVGGRPGGGAPGDLGDKVFFGRSAGTPGRCWSSRPARSAVRARSRDRRLRVGHHR